MRIISGKYKNKLIPTINSGSYRPSTNKLKESMFNILDSLILKGIICNYDKLNVIDLFCGTGSLGFEALSRGAKFITLVDNNHKHLKLAKEFIISINQLDKTEFICKNVSDLSIASMKYDVIFIDPPYYNNLIDNSLSFIISEGWCNNNAVIFIESEKTTTVDFNEHHQLTEIVNRTYGNTRLTVLLYKE